MQLTPLSHTGHLEKKNGKIFFGHGVQYSLLVSLLYMFQAVSPPIIRSSKTVNTASGICQDCLLLLLAGKSSNSPTLTVAASNLDTYPMLCVQFLSSWWWAEKPPETCRETAWAASNLDLYPMLYVQFLSSWWWAEKPPETCRALTIIKNIM